MSTTSKQIVAYGLTEQRLFVALMPAWFLATNLLLLVAPSRLLLGLRILALVLLVGSFGPWSVSNIAFQDQKSRLVSTLADTGLLLNGVGQQAQDPSRVPMEKLWALSSFADFFVDRNRADALVPFLPPSSTLSADKKEVSAKDFLAAFGVPYVDVWNRRGDLSPSEKEKIGAVSFRLDSGASLAVSITGYEKMWYYEYLSAQGKGGTLTYDGKEYLLSGNEEKGLFTLSYEGKIVAAFNIKDGIQDLYNNKKINEINTSDSYIQWNTGELPHLEIKAQGLRWRLFFKNAGGSIKQEKIVSVNQINSVHILVGHEQ